MNELINLINAYLAVGRNFLTSFFDEKKIYAPKSNCAWASKAIEQDGNLKNGTIYFKHGYGINFKNKDWKISIDFGDRGEWDGFDAYRLFLFIEENGIKSPLQNEDEVQALLTKGVKKGIFVKREDLYFKK